MKSWICILSTLLLFSCYEDYDNTSIEVIEEQPTTLVNGGVNGKVVNLNPVDYADYTLEINGDMFEIKDSFVFNYINGLSKEGQVINLVKDNVLQGMGYGFIKENDINYIEITRFPEASVVNTETGTPNEISIASDFKLVLDQNYTSTSGTPYSGSVEISNSYLNGAEYRNYLPRYVKTDGGGYVLDEIKSAFSIQLNDNQGMPVEVSASQSYIELIGQTGSFTLFKLIGNTLVELDMDNNSRFGYAGAGLYIYASKVPATLIESFLYSDEGNIAQARLNIAGINHYTTHDGVWIAALETGDVVDINLSGDCGIMVEDWTVDVSNYNSASGLKLNDNQHLLPLRLELIDCQEGLAQFPAILSRDQGVITKYVFRDGTVNAAIVSCNGASELAAGDALTGEKGAFIEWSNDLGDDLRYLGACSDYDQAFAYIVINGEPKLYDSFSLMKEGSSTILRSADDRFRLRFQGTEEGPYPTESVNLFINDDSFGSDGFSISCENSPLGCGIEYFNVTHFKDDDWFRVSLEGEIWAQTLDPPIAGYYPIKAVIMIK